MKSKYFNPDDRVMLLKGDMKKMKVVDYLIDIQKIDKWQYWESPIWEEDVLVECTWEDNLGLPQYAAFNPNDLILLDNQETNRRLFGNDYLESISYKKDYNNSKDLN